MNRLFLLACVVSIATAFTIDYDAFNTAAEKNFFISAMIISGFFLTFFGVQLFKPALFVLTFIGMFFLTTEVVGPHLSQDSYVYATGACIALAVSIISVSVLGFGLILVGLLVGSLFAGICYITFLHYLPGSTEIILYSSVAVAGAIGCYIGFKATRFFIAIATALFGAFCVVGGIDLATSRQLTVQNVKNQHLDGLGWGLLAGGICFSVLGAFIQLKSKSHPRELKSQRYYKVGHVVDDKTDPLIYKV